MTDKEIKILKRNPNISMEEAAALNGKGIDIIQNNKKTENSILEKLKNKIKRLEDIIKELKSKDKKSLWQKITK